MLSYTIVQYNTTLELYSMLSTSAAASMVYRICRIMLMTLRYAFYSYNGVVIMSVLLLVLLLPTLYTYTNVY